MLFRSKSSGAYTVAIRKYLENIGEVASAEGSYVVAEGDTLQSIAQRQLGAADRWPEIWALNKDRYPSPDLLKVGDHLKLPDVQPR